MGNDGEGWLAIFYEVWLALLKPLAALCVGGFEGDGTGLPFEFLTGVFDLGFDLIEPVGGVFENQWNEEGADEGGNTIFGGGDFTFEDGRGILSRGGHGNFLVKVENKRNCTNFALFLSTQIA